MPTDGGGSGRTCAPSGTRFVRFLFCDYSSIVHAKAVGSGSLGRKLTEGVGSTRAQMALNVRDELIDIPQMPPVGEVRLVPDPSTYAELPWAPGSASVMCDLITADREPWFACPRSFLKRQVAAAAAEGLAVDASFELEFYLGGARGRRRRRASCPGTPSTARSGSTSSTGSSSPSSRRSPSSGSRSRAC